jgi:hypothetical protein
VNTELESGLGLMEGIILEVLERQKNYENDWSSHFLGRNLKQDLLNMK